MAAVASKLTPERMNAAAGCPTADLLQFVGTRPKGDPEVSLGVLRAVLLIPLHAEHLGADLYPAVMDRLIDAVTFTGPVSVLAISAGGSIELQLAADHSQLIDRLVLGGTACTLGPIGKRAQRAYIERPLRGERPSPALAEVVTNDVVYPLELARQTVDGIPDAQLVVYPGTSHSGAFTNRRFAPDAPAFLTDS